MHHRLKRGQGGLWEPQNIVALCGDGVRGCHGWCEANPTKGWELGFCVKPWENPAEQPIKYRLSTWALLTSDGAIDYAIPTPT